MSSSDEQNPDEQTVPANEKLRNIVADAFMAFAEDGEIGVQRVISENPEYTEQIRRRLKEAALMGIIQSASQSDSGMPQHIGEYDIIDIIGSGGMGVVYRAKQQRLGRFVALKVMRGQASASERTKQRFLREARVASRLNHPGLCTVYELGEDDGIPFIAMEFIDGEPLDKRISRMTTGDHMATGSFEDFESNEAITTDAEAREESESFTQAESVDEILRIFRLALNALEAGHETGMIHRDLKPSNIIVRTTGEPVILDFGLAVAPDSDDLTLTQAGDVLGTPAYMSPEQVTQSGAALDQRTDVYSMGVSLYHCLTGRRPFVAATRQALFRSIMNGVVQPPRRFNKNISRDLEVVLSTAMEPDRGRRYQTAAAFADDIRRIQARRPIAARRASMLLRTWRWGQRNPVTATLTVALLLFLAAFSTTLSIKNKALDQQRTELSSTLSRLTRLADRRKLDELIDTANELWPARPQVVQSMDEWIFDAEALLAEADQHTSDLSQLQGSSLPYSARDQQRDHPDETTRLSELNRAENRIETLSEQAENEQRADELDNWLDAIDQERRGIQDRVRVRQTWRFLEGENHEWRFGLLRELVERVEELRHLVEVIRARRSFAQSVFDRSVTNVTEQWDAATQRVRADKRFNGFQLQPITGLVPLGPDRESHLEEFCHLDTHKGALMARDARGDLPLNADCGVIFVLVPGGEFSMGAERSGGVNSDPAAIEERETPVVKIQLSPFLIAKHELTVAQWSRFQGQSSPLAAHQLILPIGSIRWVDCVEALRQMDLALPTEAQWECAARATTHAPWWTGSTTDSLLGAANLADQAAARAGRTWPSIAEWQAFNDRFELTAPAYSMRPNPWGLHHVLGNVAEWCQDAYQGYTSPPLADDGLRSLVAAPTRVIRGGSYYSSPFAARSAVRSHDRPDARSPIIGVRPARSARP